MYCVVVRGVDLDRFSPNPDPFPEKLKTGSNTRNKTGKDQGLDVKNVDPDQTLVIRPESDQDHDVRNVDPDPTLEIRPDRIRIRT